MGGPQEEEEREVEEEAVENDRENDEGRGNLSSHDAMTSGNWSEGFGLDLLQLPLPGIPLSDAATVTQRRNQTTRHTSYLSNTSERRDNRKQMIMVSLFFLEIQ